MIVGIDLGTTHSLIGVFEAGFPTLLADAEGRRLTPSVVHFPREGEPFAGWTAKRLRGLEPDSTLSSVKRHMGESVRLGAKSAKPEEISAVILGQLKSVAERALGETVDRAVITVPAYFNDAQRAATKRAGELAGFTVERILSEPTAAALAYGLDRLSEKSRIAVYDLGGGTFDLSILELSNGVFEVLSTNGDTQLGGDDLDRALFDYLSRKLDLAALDSSATMRLREAVEQAKMDLSERETVVIPLPFLSNHQSLSLELTRAELEAVCRPFLDRTREHCFRSLHDARLVPADLDEVILVGGATRMPLVRRMVGEWFEREPNLSQHPDEAVAIGAVIQAGILDGALRNVTLLDVTPLSLGIETFGGLMNVLIPRNTTIPCKAGEMFTNAVTNQQSMRISVMQGEREIARDNFKLGEFEIPFTSAAKGQARVGVQFEIDANGLLKVLARDIATNRDTVVEIRSAVDVADVQVEQMITASVDHAFDDMAERLFIETKLKAEELLAAVESARGQIELTAEEAVQIAGLQAEVKSALGTRETSRLKKAVAELDDLTEPLAARILEKLME